MRVFITGATGFIGTRLVKRLSATDHELRCLARQTSDVQPLEAAGIDITFGDIIDKESVVRGMQGCDWVVHLASSFEFWVPDRQVYQAVNIDGVRNVMESALATNVKKVVLVSTAAVFGNSPWPITEESEFGPLCASRYAQTKREGEMIAWRMHEEEGLPLVVIYPGAVIGADDPKAAGRYLRKIALGKMPAQVAVDSVFPWVHVQDVCEAIVRALETDGNIGEKYLVNAANLTWGEMNRLICAVSGSKPPRLRLPNWATVMSARLLTGIADLFKKPPLLDLSVDQVALMMLGGEVDGSKAERELGFTYTPIREAVADAVARFRG